MRTLIIAAVAAVLGTACGAPVLKYTPNAQAITDQMYKASVDFTREIPLTATSRVAIVNLDGTMTESSSPSVPIYDMLAIALSKRKVPVVERDAEALYASVLESWSGRLPFRVSSPCGKLCPDKPIQSTAAPAPDPAKAGAPPTIIVQGCSTNCAPDAKPGECRACNQPTLAAPAKDLVDIVQELARLRQQNEEKEEEGGFSFPGLPSDDTQDAPESARSYRDLFSEVILPGWFAADGGKIVASQASATHILGYRVLTYGAAVFKTTNKDMIRREVRIDLVLRLIRVDDGVVEWSERVAHTFDERLPAELQGALKAKPYSFSSAQYGPEEE